MINERDYVELGLGCVDICRALDRGMRGKTLDDLSQSVCEAINQLTTWVKSMMRGLNGSLNDGLDRTKNCGGDPKESHQRKRTERSLSASPCEERQGNDRRLEVRPQQDPPCLQRAFSYFCLASANRSLSDRAGNQCSYYACGYTPYRGNRSGKC